MQILHNVCWYCYRILWLFMIIWWHGFEKWDFIDYFQHKRSDMINHNHHYYLIIIIYIISHSSILCSLSLYVLSTADLRLPSVIVPQWPNVDWTVTILSHSSLFISGHYVSRDSYIYYPLFKNVSLFGWIHECTVGLNSFFIQIIRHFLKAISYNGVSLKQRFYFLLVRSFFLWCISILFRMYYYDYISRLLTHGSPLINQFWIFLFKTQLNWHTYYLHFHNFYFIDYYCYHTYICYFLNNIYHKQFIFLTYLENYIK